MPADKQKVYETLRFEIIKNDLKAGEFLNEKKLMVRFKIGRTPLREVFLRLQRAKLINMIPRQGTVVTPIDFKDLREIVEIRRGLEALVGQLAVKRLKDAHIASLKEIIKKATNSYNNEKGSSLKDLSQYDMDFHNCMLDAIQNTRLKEMLYEQQNAMGRFAWLLGLKPEDFFSQFKQLEDVVSALEEKNVEKVQAALQVHLDWYIDKVKNDIL